VYAALKFLHFLTPKHAVFTASLTVQPHVNLGVFALHDGLRTARV